MPKSKIEDIFQNICIDPNCSCGVSDPCIKNFVKEKCTKKNDYWINLINTTSKDIEVSQKGLRKTLTTSHRDLLVRWLVQLNKDGEDSYSYFRSLKTSKKTIEYLKKMDNCLFSEQSAYLISNVINNPKSTCGGKLHYEHNPPVKVITQKLDKLEIISDNDIVETICDKKYCVMIINSAEHKVINTTSRFSQRGSFDERCKVAKIEKLYRINPKWLKASKRKS